MNQTTSIREYSESDSETLKQLIGELHDFVVATDPIKRIRHQPGFIDQQLSDIQKVASEQNGKIFFALEDKKIVGFAVCFVGKKQTKENLLEVIPTQIGIINDLFVSQEYRNLGIGKKLLTHCETYLQKQGCDSVWIDIFAPNKKAWGFYKNQGYLSREVGLLKKI